MGKHTPEPWGVFQDASGDVFVSSKVTSFHIAEVGSEDDETVIPDASRIVACVNACRGLSTEELEQKGLVSAVGTQLIEADKRSDDMEFVIDKAKDLLVELRKDIELTIHNNKVVNNSRVVAIAEAKLRRIDEILNWKGDE